MAPPPPPNSKSAPEVSARDQELINEFNRLHQRREELEAAARARKADESDAADAVEEVSTAYLVADDDSEEPPVRFVVGECFLHSSSEEAAEARAEAAKEEASKEAAAAAGAEREAAERMRELKATLYSKFGDSINLEA